MFNVILELFLTYITNYRRDHRRPVQSSGAGRPANRGGRKGEHHLSVNHQRDQHGTRVFKNSPMNTQKGKITGPFFFGI